MSGATGAAAGAAYAQMINAVRSFGVIVTVSPEEFLDILDRHEDPLVVFSTAGIFVSEYRYLVSYKGLVFFAKSSYPLDLPENTEIVRAGKLYLPG